jgi:hypothetical protein
MSKRIRALTLAALVILGSVGLITAAPASSAAAYRLVATSLPYSNTSVNTCVGGAQCGLSTLTVDLPKPTGIGTVTVFAHDNIGDQHGGYLGLRVDGRYVQGLDVKAEGSTLTFTVNQVGDSLEFADYEDEIMIKSIKITSASVSSTSPTQGVHHHVVSALPYSNLSANTCIGGSLCKQATLVVDLTRRAGLTTVEVFAHDQVGSGTNGSLQLALDRQPLVNEYFETIVLDVKKEGSWLTFQVGNQVAQRLELRSTTDETVIKSIKINGRFI